MPDLKELLGQELYEQVSGKLGQEHRISIVSDGNWIPKDKFNTVIEEKNQFKTQLETMNSELAKMQESAKGNDELKTKFESLQAENQKFNDVLKSTKLEAAVKLAAVQSKANDPDDIVRFLDMSKLDLADDGTVKGLEDQLKVLSDSKAYLFTNPVAGSRGMNPSGQQHQSELQQLQEQYNQAPIGSPLRIALTNKIHEVQTKMKS